MKPIHETSVLLNHALVYHKSWLNQQLRVIMCHLSDEYPECSFNSENTKLNQLHSELHQQAKILQHSHNKNQDCETNYNKLMDLFDQFNTEIYALQKELEMSGDIQPETMTTPTMITMLPILLEQQTFAKRQLQMCYIALINIDLLNKLEEDYGAITKDKILVTLAQLLVEQLRGYDKVFCYNPETFLVSLQNVNAEQAFDLINRLRIKISKHPINIGLIEPLFITVSCGITALDPTFTMEQLLQQANIALYLAKKTGRNNTKAWGS